RPAPRRAWRPGVRRVHADGRRPPDRPGPPAGADPGRRGAPDPDRVPPAREPREARGQGRHAPAAPPRGLGPERRGAVALPARLHGAPPAQAREEPRAAALSADRGRLRLPAADGVTARRADDVAHGARTRTMRWSADSAR